MIRKFSKSGWYGNSQGHALAARGLKLYAKKSTPSLVNPIFYARRDKQIPFDHILDMVKEGKSYSEMKSMHPEVDSEDLRSRGIRAYEARAGSNTLSTIDKQGVDATVRMSKINPSFRDSTSEVINDPQASSFLAPVKVESLKSGLRVA